MAGHSQLKHLVASKDAQDAPPAGRFRQADSADHGA